MKETRKGSRESMSKTVDLGTKFVTKVFLVGVYDRLERHTRKGINRVSFFRLFTTNSKDNNYTVNKTMN